MEQLYKISEVAKKMSITTRTIYRWIDSGKINIVRINGNPRVTESELQRLMKGE